MLKGRGFLAIPPLFPAKSWTLSLTLKRSSYPIITEEAGPALTHKPPHQAHPLALGAKGLESTVFYSPKFFFTKILAGELISKILEYYHNIILCQLKIAGELIYVSSAHNY
jgi:hypothetical protein